MSDFRRWLILFTRYPMAGRVKALFEEIGGFADLPIMEDYEILARLRRRGRLVSLAARRRSYCRNPRCRQGNAHQSGPPNLPAVPALRPTDRVPIRRDDAFASRAFG